MKREEVGWWVGLKHKRVGGGGLGGRSKYTGGDINPNLITAREKIYWLDCVTVGEYITCPSIGG